MPATSPALKADNWIDDIVLRPGEEPFVPRFSLLETPAPDARAMALSPVILMGLLTLAFIWGRLPSDTRKPIMQDITFLVAPPEPQSSEPRTIVTYASPPPAVEPVEKEQSEVTAHAADLQQPPKHRHRRKQSIPEVIVAKAAPTETVKKPALSIPAIPVRQPVVPVKPSATPILTAKIAEPEQLPLAPAGNPPADQPKPPEKAPTSVRDAAGDSTQAVPKSLGGVQLSEIIQKQDGLAAGLAALPWSERLNLPRVSIRVNTAWVEALPKTQERLYFSIEKPQADQEVLAYVPESRSFELERPERPLWQIHDAERVPELVQLRASASQSLGVSPELVGLYTWHPPAFEDALRMFVLERMQELRVHLGPRDIVTVRLASSAGGMVMNLEPIQAEASP
jgi:hypothetical protein